MEVYEGEYVAVVGAKVVAHGRDGKKVYDKACRKYPKRRILLGQVPVKEAMVLWLAFTSGSRGRGRKFSVTYRDL